MIADAKSICNEKLSWTSDIMKTAGAYMENQDDTRGLTLHNKLCQKK
jgi:hypothetical protein